MAWKEYVKNEPWTLLKFNDRWLRMIVIPIFALISQFALHPTPTDSFFVKITTSLIITIIYWHISRSIILYFRRRLPNIQDYFKRMVFQIIGLILSNIILFVLIGLLLRKTLPQFITNTNYSSSFFIPFAFTFSIVLIYESIYLLHEWKQAALGKEITQKEQVITQLKVLQNQTNPHFLFNSLNTLSSFIQEQPNLAEKYVNKLAEVYRYMLNIHKHELITLKEELDFLADYYFLMQIRYGKNLHLEIKNNGLAKSKYIIPMSLQILLENAIKHNIISNKQPLHISLNIEKNNVSITNKHQPKLTKKAHSNETGLSNLIKRYQLISELSPTISNDQIHFQVTLPLLNINQYQTS